MAKITLPDVGSGYNLTQINENFQLLEDALNDEVMYRDNPTGESTAWITDQDANAKKLLNLPNALTAGEPVPLRQFLTGGGGGGSIEGDFSGFETVAAMISDVNHSIGDYVYVEDYATGNNSGNLFFKVVAAGTGTANGGDFIDLVGSSLQAKQNFPGYRSVMMFGAVGDDITDDSVPIQAAINSAGTLHKVVFPTPNDQYAYGTTLVAPGGQTWQGDIDWSATRTPTVGASILRYTGTTDAITCGELTWINVVLLGNVNSLVAPNIGTGITNTGNLRFSNSTVRGFDVGIESNGGFYHTFSGCTFFHNKVCMNANNANNVNFTNGTRFVNLDTAVTCTGGVGNINFTNCALERWTDNLVQHLAGSKNSVAFNQCYIENYPTIAISEGLTDVGGTGNYDLAVVTSQGKSTTITDSIISCKGIKRVITGTSRNLTKMEGNTVILWASGGPSNPTETEAIVSLSGQPELLIMKDSYQFIDNTGADSTFATSGITTEQVVNNDLGKEFERLDYEGNVITSGQRNVSVSTDRTLTEADFGKTLRMLTGGDAVITIPTLHSGFICYVSQDDANVTTTFVAGSGMSNMNSPANQGLSIVKRHGIAKITLRSTSSASLTGDLVEVIDQDSNSSTSFTPGIENTNQLMTLTNASAIACTIPPNVDVPYEVGITLFFKQGGAGQITYAPGAGVTLNSELGLKSTGQEAPQAFYQESANVWWATGRLEP